MTKEIEDLQKSIAIASTAVGKLGKPFSKAQLELFSSFGKVHGHTPEESAAHKASNMAQEASDIALMHGNPGDDVKASQHAKAAALNREASRQAEAVGDLDSAQYHASLANRHEAHHKAYTRTNQSGTVSNIDAKGPQTEAPAPLSRKAAQKKLQAAADHNHGRHMYSKPEKWSDTEYRKGTGTGEKHEISASHIEGTEAAHHDMIEVYGHHVGNTAMGAFSREFHEKNQGEPFVMKHMDGKKYLVDPQGYHYARYISRIKD